MTKSKALVGLNMFCNIGSARLSKLLEYFGEPENILKASYDALAATGIGAKITGKVCALKEKDIDKELHLAEKFKLKIVTTGDEDYPDNLKEIPGAPIVLYVKGDLKKEDRSAIAIVGSRRASPYGLENACRFSGDLAGSGMTVVSGLARGVDTAAHKGALKKGGRTIAVIGSGFGHIYPPENKKLAEEICRSGAVISEFPVGAKPLPENFPRRNRVISGLSLGVLVAEAAMNSGALITADFALEQGREVFALPGKIDSENSFGTNELIKQGAKLVSSAEEIMEEFNLPVQKDHPVRALSDGESLLYRLLSDEPLYFDDIAERSGMSVVEISSGLLKLQMRKLVSQLPGKQFIRNRTS
ncbi:MAG: DNA-processing protein DprA [Candidatus Omnitrophica bacterium]|nr:DNA-processing protein DprA [Candidatus Omnitrophota bacterium]MDD5552391.1 DNA-processing protein DprA [Candidatus Omnitrophota bacterium]